MWSLMLQFSGWWGEDPAGPTVQNTAGGRPNRCEIGEDGSAVIRYDADRDILAFAPVDAGEPGPAGAAVVTARRGHWCLTNLHAEDSCFVENMEGGGGEFVKVPPRRRDTPIPFELARLVLAVPRGTGLVSIFGPEPPYLAAADTALSDRVTNWPRLDEQALYFRVLVALCEPQLRGGPPGAVPTVGEVIARLGAGRRSAEMTRAAVNHHIAYLANEKLRVAEWAGLTEGGRSYWKREAIVAMVLRAGLVCERHLRLLPPPRRVTAGQRPAPAPGPVRRPRLRR
ncbi:hypothetical protein [Streptomyces sp. NPDC014894]|uniref:hypothetical protein n=1 Tax=Streptomyces sp. NPDC014894 TaxID=3364931 RepID=UPI0036F68B88